MTTQPDATPSPPAGTVVLLRHGRSVANGQHRLAGRTPGVDLDATGKKQAHGLVDRLDGWPIAAIVTSPLERCQQTVAPLAAARRLTPEVDESLVEVDYGSWTNRPLHELRDEPEWSIVQQHPSGMRFPGGEAMAEVSARAVAAVRRHAAAHAPGIVVVCSHGDLLGMALADALGMHLDMFQRITVAPASLSVVRYLPLRPIVEYLNVPGPLPAPTLAAPEPTPAGEAVIGGVTGPES